ncbi:hypothetical protein FSARC_8487 [Fusarium sarcochroum]|uniref:Uncharacterized protein n=1 Tax=Fusarium sarcochroum TaxID=1208366 RepID=A0A8H4TSU5_9HYPO|nr:hypothetical protein FSARC_8487 [Fusarium sarcochroum]
MHDEMRSSTPGPKAVSGDEQELTATGVGTVSSSISRPQASDTTGSSFAGVSVAISSQATTVIRNPKRYAPSRVSTIKPASKTSGLKNPFGNDDGHSISLSNLETLGKGNKEHSEREFRELCGEMMAAQRTRTLAENENKQRYFFFNQQQKKREMKEE